MDKCQKIVHPLTKGAVDYQCRSKHYADGWCKRHHPKIVAAKETERELLRRECAVERKAKLEQAEGAVLTIENAIVLLVQNGYRVELKEMPNFQKNGLSSQISLRKLLPEHEDGCNRAINCLGAQGIYTVDQLVTWTEADLLRTPNLGRKLLLQIIRKLAAHGLGLKEAKPSQ